MDMTQHLLEKDTQEDIQTLKRLGKIVGGFLLATALLALAVGLAVG
jgi:predicted PurR-regulated permease PerM